VRGAPALTKRRRWAMGILWIILVVVVVLAILGFLGAR
jgi:flagellar basal body-associated protein FliL